MKECLNEKDIILFKTNQPAIHLLEMFGTTPFNPKDIEKEEYIGLIESVMPLPMPDLSWYTTTSISPLDGFFCLVSKEDIIRKMDKSELTEEQQNKIEYYLKKRDQTYKGADRK